jgi:hypothetical protein
MSCTARKVRKRFALHHGAFEHDVHALSGTLNHAALAQCLRKAPIPGILLIQDILGRDARWETAWADDFKPARELTDKNRSAEPVVAVANGIEDCFSDHPFVEGRYLKTEESILVALTVIALVDLFPKLIIE